MFRPDKPFADWDTNEVCQWLEDLGLEQYSLEAKKFVKSGQQLQEATITEIEKELLIKNPLHKKKLQLAIIDTQENGSSDSYLKLAGKLDTAWVLRWLDDVGLPQHKESFLMNRVDGRVLHRLTMDDLAFLHVTSLLHVASLKRGIQVLRENNYEPGCLQRRSLPEDPSQPTPKQVALWTTHRFVKKKNILWFSKKIICFLLFFTAQSNGMAQSCRFSRIRTKFKRSWCTWRAYGFRK